MEFVLARVFIPLGYARRYIPSEIWVWFGVVEDDCKVRSPSNCTRITMLADIVLNNVNRSLLQSLVIKDSLKTFTKLLPLRRTAGG